MTEVTVIGLGYMGSALARALIAAGHRTTVWNRSAAKAEPLARMGAEVAPNVGAALAASPIILVCIDNYSASHSLLESERLEDKTLIQLSTGTPREAREAEAWARLRRAQYLDGAIIEYPSAIGSESALILVSGPRIAFETSEAVLKSLGGGLRYLGDNIAEAASLDMALLTKALGLMVGVIHGARICEAEGVSVDAFVSALPPNEDSRFFADLIARDAFDNPGATMKTWDGSVQRIVQQARDANINGEVPAFIAGLFRRGLAAGYGSEDMMALVKVLRTASASQNH